MNMKQFVGLVNGKSFDNEEDFRKAVKDFIKNNHENLSISSYYKYSNDDENTKKEISKPDENYVSPNECFIGDRNPDSVGLIDPELVGSSGYTNIEYNVSPELEERLKIASNKKYIKEKIDHHIKNLVDKIKNTKEDMSNIEKKIESLQKELFNTQGILLDLEGRRKYYDHILDIVEKEDVTDEVKNDDVKKKELKITPDMNNIKKLLDIDENTSLFDILRQLSILK